MRKLFGALILLSAISVSGCAFAQRGPGDRGAVDRYGGGRTYLPAPAQGPTRVLTWPGKTAPAPSMAPVYAQPGSMAPAPYAAGYTPYPQPGYAPPGAYPPPAAYYPSVAYPGVPAPAYPAPGYPAPGYPTAGYPTQGYPTQGYPTAGYPTAGYPGGAVPGQPIPPGQINPGAAPMVAPAMPPPQAQQFGPAQAQPPAPAVAPGRAPASSPTSVPEPRVMTVAANAAPRVYSLHRDFGMAPDGVPQLANAAAASGVDADPLPQQFFGTTQNLADPGETETTVVRQTDSKGNVTTKTITAPVRR